MANLMSRTLALVLAFLFVTPHAFADVVSHRATTDITPDSVLAAMNDYRAQYNLPPLQHEARLVAAAADRMRDMEELSYWSHESPDGRSPFMWLRVRNYPFANAGENLASGFETTELLVSSWMESKGHRANILSPMYTDVGIAIIDGATTGSANGKSIVVLFGRQRSDK